MSQTTAQRRRGRTVTIKRDVLEQAVAASQPHTLTDVYGGAQTSLFPTLALELYLEILSYYPVVPKRAWPIHNHLPPKYCDRPSVIRALSQTCHALRRIFLPLLWERFDACAPPDGLWYKHISATLEARSIGLQARADLAVHVRIANVVLTRCAQNTVLPSFAQCLSQLPNLHTLQFIHVHPAMTTPLKNSFQGIELPAVHTIVLPAHAHHVLRCCPEVRTVICIEGESNKLVTAILEKCPKVEVLKGFPLIPRQLKRIVQAVPNLLLIEVDGIVGPYGNRSRIYFSDSREPESWCIRSRRDHTAIRKDISTYLSAFKALSTIEIVAPKAEPDFKITGKAEFGDMVELAREVLRKATHKEARCVKVIIRTVTPNRYWDGTAHAEETVERIRGLGFTLMFFDLNVLVPQPSSATLNQLKKGKGKGNATHHASAVVYTPALLGAIEARVDLLVHLGYTVIAFNQTAYKKVETKTHVNILDDLLSGLKKRPGVIFLRRLTIVLDDDSEKGFGLTNANASLFSSYDIIALAPTTPATFSLACLTHSLPSPLTAHIIALPLTQPRLPFHLKHTLVRTAIKNGAVFEINYAGALGSESDPPGEGTSSFGIGESGVNAAVKRNWWAAARELTRVTKGKGIIISGGVISETNIRAPRDVANLITLLGLPPDAAHASMTKTPKSLVLRAETRKTYRAVFSEPRVVIPPTPTLDPSALGADPTDGAKDVDMLDMSEQGTRTQPTGTSSTDLPDQPVQTTVTSGPPKRPRSHDDGPRESSAIQGDSTVLRSEEPTRKKKRRRNKNPH